MTACLLYAKIHKNKVENLLHLMLYFSNERASCKNILTKSYDDTILKAKEGRWLQIGQLLTGIMSKRLTARLGNRGGQSFLLLE